MTRVTGSMPRSNRSPGNVASLLASILSDPDARAAEFGAMSVLDLPLPTAVKTGTSSDYHDIWTVGFDNRYTVGVWMGNLDGTATDRLTGSTGPAPVLRQVFARLRSVAPYAGLWHSPALRPVETCEWIGPPPCVHRREWYLPSSGSGVRVAADGPDAKPAIARPLPGETLAIDPRLPLGAQRFRFTLDANGAAVKRVIWQVDGQPLPETGNDTSNWQLVPGPHRVGAQVWLDGKSKAISLPPVEFNVLGQMPDAE